MNSELQQKKYTLRERANSITTYLKNRNYFDVSWIAALHVLNHRIGGLEADQYKSFTYDNDKQVYTTPAKLTEELECIIIDKSFSISYAALGQKSSVDQTDFENWYNDKPKDDKTIKDPNTEEVIRVGKKFYDALSTYLIYERENDIKWAPKKTAASTESPKDVSSESMPHNGTFSYTGDDGDVFEVGIENPPKDGDCLIHCLRALELDETKFDTANVVGALRNQIIMSTQENSKARIEDSKQLFTPTYWLGVEHLETIARKFSINYFLQVVTRDSYFHIRNQEEVTNRPFLNLIFYDDHYYRIKTLNKIPTAGLWKEAVVQFVNLSRLKDGSGQYTKFISFWQKYSRHIADVIDKYIPFTVTCSYWVDKDAAASDPVSIDSKNSFEVFQYLYFLRTEAYKCQLFADKTVAGDLESFFTSLEKSLQSQTFTKALRAAKNYGSEVLEQTDEAPQIGSDMILYRRYAPYFIELFIKENSKYNRFYDVVSQYDGKKFNDTDARTLPWVQFGNMVEPILDDIAIYKNDEELKKSIETFKKNVATEDAFSRLDQHTKQKMKELMRFLGVQISIWIRKYLREKDKMIIHAGALFGTPPPSQRIMHVPLVLSSKKPDDPVTHKFHTYKTNKGMICYARGRSVKWKSKSNEDIVHALLVPGTVLDTAEGTEHRVTYDVDFDEYNPENILSKDEEMRLIHDVLKGPSFPPPPSSSPSRPEESPSPSRPGGHVPGFGNHHAEPPSDDPEKKRAFTIRSDDMLLDRFDYSHMASPGSPSRRHLMIRVGVFALVVFVILIVIRWLAEDIVLLAGGILYFALASYVGWQIWSRRLGKSGDTAGSGLLDNASQAEYVVMFLVFLVPVPVLLGEYIALQKRTGRSLKRWHLSVLLLPLIGVSLYYGFRFWRADQRASQDLRVTYQTYMSAVANGGGLIDDRILYA